VEEEPEEVDDDQRPQRNRSQVQRINQGHDEWQTMATTQTKFPTVSRATASEEFERSFRKRGIRLKEDVMATKGRQQERERANIKMNVQCCFLAARRGGLAKAMRFEQLVESGGQ
jgi:hypothetical protein